MPFIALDGTTLDLESFEEVERLPIGDRYETFDGTDRTSIYAYKRRFRGRTRPLSTSDHSTYRSALLSDSSLAATGDAIGSMTVSARITSEPFIRIRVGSTFQRAIEFELRER